MHVKVDNTCVKCTPGYDKPPGEGTPRKTGLGNAGRFL